MYILILITLFLLQPSWGKPFSNNEHFLAPISNIENLKKLAALESSLTNNSGSSSDIMDFNLSLSGVSDFDLINVFRKILTNEYNISSVETEDLLGNQSSPTEIILKIINIEIERRNHATTIPLLCQLLISSEFNNDQQAIIWSTLSNLSIKSSDIVVKNLNKTKISLSDLDITINSSRKNQAIKNELFEILKNFISSETNSLSDKKDLAKQLLNNFEDALKDNRSIILHREFLLELFDLIEPEVIFDKGWRKTAHQRYISQLFLLNNIFQNVMDYLKNDVEKLSYEDFIKMINSLIQSENILNPLSKLTKMQIIQVKESTMRAFNQKLNLKNEYEKIRRIVEPFNELSIEMISLNKDLKKAKKEKNRSRISNLSRKRKNIVRKLEKIRNSKTFIQVLADKFQITKEDAPYIAIFKMGFLSLQIELDSHSLQQAFKSKIKFNSLKKTPVNLRAFEKIEKKQELDFNKVQSLLYDVPNYLYNDFQDEMLAYMTDNKLRSIDFNYIIDAYRRIYSNRILNSIEEDIKKQNNIIFDEQTLRSDLQKLLDNVWEGTEWKNMKKNLIMSKNMLDKLVDAKATLIFNKQLARHLNEDISKQNIQQLKNESYKQASNFIMGLFQFIPILNIERLQPVLLNLEKEIEQKGITPEKRLSIVKRIIEMEKTDQIIVGGFYRTNTHTVFSRLKNNEEFIDHERQHLIFDHYTGFEVRKYTRKLSYGLSKLSKAFRNKSVLKDSNLDILASTEISAGVLSSSRDQESHGFLDDLGKRSLQQKSA